MRINKITAYQKIGDIATQIEGIIDYKQKLEKETPSEVKIKGLRPIGSDKEFTFEQVIDFHFKRIDLLGNIVHNDINKVMADRNQYYRSLCYSCQINYLQSPETSEPCEKDYESWCFLTLFDLVLEE